MVHPYQELELRSKHMIQWIVEPEHGIRKASCKSITGSKESINWSLRKYTQPYCEQPIIEWDRSILTLDPLSTKKEQTPQVFG